MTVKDSGGRRTNNHDVTLLYLPTCQQGLHHTPAAKEPESKTVTTRTIRKACRRNAIEAPARGTNDV